MNKMKELKAIFVGGRYDGKEVTQEELIKMGNGEFTPDMSECRKQGGLCWREELDNQPLVDGYIGPCWDGGKLRYETQEVYDMLSC